MSIILKLQNIFQYYFSGYFRNIQFCFSLDVLLMTSVSPYLCNYSGQQFAIIINYNKQALLFSFVSILLPSNNIHITPFIYFIFFAMSIIESRNQTTTTKNNEIIVFWEPRKPGILLEVNQRKIKRCAWYPVLTLKALYCHFNLYFCQFYILQFTFK